MRIILISLALAVSAAGQPGPGKGTCNADIPVKLEIQQYHVDGAWNAIQGDGNPYVNGQDGVTARVLVCDGTGNAGLSLSTTRHTTIDFSQKLAPAPIDNPYDDPFVGSVDCFGRNICWGFVIRNILCLGVDASGNRLCPGREEEYEFTTHLAGHGPLYAKVYMFNPGADVPWVQDQFTVLANNPYPNSLVRVHHCPANFQGASVLCTAGQRETWFAWPEKDPKPIPGQTLPPPSATYVATLILNGWTGKPRGPLNGGEYSIPFLFKISALQ